MNETFSWFLPLKVTRSETTKVVHMVLVLRGTLQHIGNRLKSAVWMRRKASDVISYVKATEFIKHQKRVKTVQVSSAQDPFKPHSTASSGPGSSFTLLPRLESDMAARIMHYGQADYPAFGGAVSVFRSFKFNLIEVSSVKRSLHPSLFARSTR